MRIGRTLPPAAAPLGWRDLAQTVPALFAGDQAVAAREDEIRREFGVDHVFLVSSGSAALVLTLTALKALTGRSAVVIPAYTCFSVPAAVLKAGLRPILCDIDPATFDFDASRLERTVTTDTLCVVVHHLFGVPSAIERTRSLCADRGAFTVEDAAQAMGAEVRGRKLGTLGDVGIFSFGRGKNITCGSGGAVLTRSNTIAAALAARYRELPSPPAREVLEDLLRLLVMAIFIRPCLYWIPAALPFLRLGETLFPGDVPLRRLGRVKAGLLRGWSRRLARSNLTRAETAAYFGQRLSLSSRGPHPYLRVPLLTPTPYAKTKLHELSKTRGLGLSAAYPSPVNDIPQIRAGFEGQRFPSAEHVAARLVTIPTHEWVTRRDRQAIAELCLTCHPS